MNPLKTDIKVVASVSVSDGNGGVAIICDISDGSIWKCDATGTKWEMIRPSYDILTSLFITNKPDDDTQVKNPINIVNKDEEKKNK